MDKGGIRVLGTHFIQRFEEYFPPFLAEKGDPVGLQIGTLNKDVKKIMVTLDVRPEVVKEAAENNIDLLIAKHPPLFRPASNLLDDFPQTHMYNELVRNNIAVYTAHTNMDIVENGLNDWFLEALNVKGTEFLTKTHELSYKKLVLYLSEDSKEDLEEKFLKAGAKETATFNVENLKMYVNKNHLKHKVKVKITVTYLETKEKAMLQVLKEMNVVDYDLYTTDLKKDYGIGRIGYLPEAMTVENFAKKVKETFHVKMLRVISKDLDKPVNKIAICGGSGEKFYPAALSKGCDVYITGDVYYHTAHDMLETDLSVIDPGHYIEYYCKEKMLHLFENWKKENQWDVDFSLSKVSTDPFTII